MDLSRLAKFSPNNADGERIAAGLRQIRLRMSQVKRSLDTGPTTGDLEVAALNLRMVLEMVVLLSFASHRPLFESATDALGKKSPDAARRAVSKLNPGYWPKPVDMPEPGEIAEKSEGFLRESRWGWALGKTSELLHAKNPFRLTDISVDAETMRGIYDEVMTLTDMFIIDLAGTGLALLCSADHAHPTSDVVVRVMVSEKSWPDEYAQISKLASSGIEPGARS